MNKNDYIHSLHNVEQSRDIITSAVNSFCDHVTDSCLIIDVGFERLVQLDSDYDTTPKVDITILKAEDYRPPKRPSSKWTSEDQDAVTKCEQPADAMTEDGSAALVTEPSKSYWDSITTACHKVKNVFRKGGGSADDATIRDVLRSPPSRKEGVNINQQQQKTIVKMKAIRWELPSGEFYAVKYRDVNKRKLNLRRSCSDVRTAQEDPAVREKRSGMSDLTDRDCTQSIVTVSNSMESVIQEEQAKAPVMVTPTTSHRASRKTKKKKSSRVNNEMSQIKSVSFTKSPASSKSVATNTSPKQKSQPLVVVVQPKKTVAISIRRRPDYGELTILGDEDKDGTVTFAAVTKHMEKRQH